MTDQTDQNTEERIISAAREIFLEKGKNGSRMQEIADKAGVNKALLHYYYRAKDQIFNKVFNQVAEELFSVIFGGLNWEDPIEILLKNFIDNHIGMIRSQRRRFQFFFSEIWMNPKEAMPVLKSCLLARDTAILNKLILRLKKGAEEKEIRPVDPFHFMMNLISLDIFYFIASPIFASIWNLENEEMKKKDSERDKEVYQFLWESIRYRGENNA